jgi:predicted dehydrogenase
MQDYVCANLLFESGILATLLASRISSADIRSFNVSSSKGYYMVDSLQQSLKVLTKPASGRGQAIEEIPIHKKDALTLQLNHFVKCVRQQTHSNLESVIRALEVAWMIEKQLALEDQSLNTSPLEEAVQTTL